MSRTAYVTGSSGFLGLNSELKYLNQLGAERVEGDICDRASRANAEQDRVNIEGTRNVVDAAIAAGARHAGNRRAGVAEAAMRLQRGDARARLPGGAVAHHGRGIVPLAAAGRLSGVEHRLCMR